MNKSNLKIQGILEFSVFKNGEFVKSYRYKNLIVNTGLVLFSKLLTGEYDGGAIGKIGFGTDDTEEALGDTSLTDQFLKAIDSVSYPAVGKASFNWTLSTLENNGVTITEFGLFTEDDEDMFSRKVGTPIVKDNTVSMQGSWIIELVNQS